MQRGASAGGVALGIDRRESSRDTDPTRAADEASSHGRKKLGMVTLATGAFFTIAGLAAVLPLLAAAVAGAVGLALALRRPGLLLALALNGFFVYLAVVDVAGRGTATLGYDTVLGGLMLLAAWRGRGLLAGRLRARGRLETAWLVAAALLAVWFLANGMLYRVGGHETRVLMGQLVIVTLPSVALALSLDRRGFADLRLGIIALGLGLVLADVVAKLGGTVLVSGRFSPIERFDPINAGLVPALAAAATLGLPGRSPRARALQALALVILAAATVVPGSRGPVLALALTIVLAVLIVPRRLAAVAVAGLAIGLTLGWGASKPIGTERYLSQGVNDVVKGIPREKGKPPAGPKTAPETLPPISTFRIRRYWITSALKAVPDKPLLGHGLVALPDTSPDAYRMGVAGELRYPHNDLVESIYSLGIPGLVLFLLLVALPTVAGYRLLRSGRGTLALLAALLFVFAFAESNFSGEIGADGTLWASGGMLIALSLDRRRPPA